MGNEQSSKGGDYHAPNRSRETAAQASARAVRAEQFESKVNKYKPKDAETIKQDHWRKYASIGAEKQNETGNQTITNGVRSAGNSPNPSAQSIATRNNQVNQPVNRPPSQTSSPAPSVVSKPAVDPREARLAAMEARSTKHKAIRSVNPTNSQWEVYKQLDEAEKQKKQPNNPSNSQQTPSPASPNNFQFNSSESKQPNNQTNQQSFNQSSDQTYITDDENFAFEQQLTTLVQLAQSMPQSSKVLLHRIVGNLLKLDNSTSPTSGQSNSPTNDQDKYRRLKLTSAKMLSDIVNVEGALDILYAVGFQLEEAGDTLYFAPGTSLTVANLAYEKLGLMI